ncbi:MAG: hypothetical protein FJW36_18995 [Acidobacteria bacterium]|nr:hypothetical protein [Acidobacteriota bacterium]
MLRTTLLCIGFSAFLSAQSSVGVAVDCVKGSVWQGQPAIFGVHLFPAALGDQTVPSGTLSIEIRKASGDPANWPLKPITRIAFPLELKPMQMASEYWALNPEESATLEPGDYTAEARFGTLASRRFRFKALTTDDVNTAALLRLRINYLRLTGDAAGAITLIEEAIVREPEDTGLLYLRALAQEQAGDRDAALSSVLRALSLFKEQFPAVKHPPLEFIRLRSKLEWAIE